LYDANCQTTYSSQKDLKKNADILFNEEDYVAALPLFSQLLSLYPKDPNYSYKFGVCLLMADKRDIEKPIKYLEAAVNSPDVEKKLYYFLGLAYHYNYRFKEAINYYNRFLQQAPRSLHKKYDASRQIEDCYNGIALLSSISDLFVLEKLNVGYRNFYRSYNVKDFGGRFLALPVELKTKIDIKKDHSPIIFYSGNTDYMYFSSYGIKEESGKDIYRVLKKEDGTWDKAEKLPNVINTEYDEDYPFLLSDGVTLFFSSKGHNSMGGYDVFKTILDTITNTWSKPQNLDFAINTPFDDILFITNNEMTSAYFASNRVSDIGMINVYKVHLESRPDKEVTQLGDVFNLSKDDPSYKRSLELLKNKTTLEVNASEAMFENTTLANKDEEIDLKDDVKDNVVVKEDQSLSNQDIIKMAYQQADESKVELNELRQKLNASKIVSEQRKQRVMTKVNDALKAKNYAERIQNPKEKENALIDANVLKYEAERLQKESEVADNIYNDIQKKVIQKEQEVKNAEIFADNIQKAIESDSPEKAIEILNKMNSEFVSEDVSEYTDKSIEEIIAAADKNIPEVKNIIPVKNDIVPENNNVVENKNNEIENLTNEVNRLNNEAAKLRKEAEKDKSMKNDLLAQARDYENEAKQIQSELNQMQQAVSENKADTGNVAVADNKNQEKLDLIKSTDGIIKNFDEDNQKLKNQYAYLQNESQNKAKESSADYNKAQKLISDSELITDKILKENKLAQAQALLDSSEKKAVEAIALSSVAQQLSTEIEKNANTKEQLNNEVKNINALIDKNDIAKAQKLIEDIKNKFKADNSASVFDDKYKNDLSKKAENAQSEANNNFLKANELYNKISNNTKEINKLKNNPGTDNKETEKNKKRIEALENDNKKLKTEADEAFRKGNEMKFEAGQLKMKVSISTSVIPSDVQANNVFSPVDNNNLSQIQSNLFNEKVKIKESQQQIALADNNVEVKVNPEIKVNPEVKDNNQSAAEKERIKLMGDDIQKKFTQAIDTFEVKAQKLYKYAEQKTTISTLGINQADKILQNAQTINDKSQKNIEIEKANKLYEKSFELAKEAMAAVSLAKDYDAQVSKMKNDNNLLNEQLAQNNKLAETGQLKEADELMKKLQNQYESKSNKEEVENQVKMSVNNIVSQKEKEALDLINLSQKQYEEAQKLKNESNNLKLQAQNTADVNQKNLLINNANQLEQKAIASKKTADDNYNKGEKIKIEVGVLRMKVDFTVKVEDMPEATNKIQNTNPNLVADVANMQQKIDNHNFSETNKETVKFSEEPVKKELQPIIETVLSPAMGIKKLEDEVLKNSQLAAEEKKKAAATNDLNQRMNIQAKANKYDSISKEAQVMIYEINSKNNKDQYDKNKSLIKDVRVINPSDDNAIRAKIQENESEIYKQKAEARKKEAAQTVIPSLKANILEDAVRNEQLALQKQTDAINAYKKALPPVKETTVQNVTPVIKETNTNVNNKTVENPVIVNNQNKQNNQLVTNNNNNPQNKVIAPVTNNQINKQLTDDKNLITNIKGLFFTVQIGVFGAARNAGQLFNLVPIYYDKLNNGFYRYFSGIFSSKESATIAKNTIKEMFDDAFVVAFNNGIRITANEAVALLQNKQAQLQTQLAFSAPAVIAPNNKNEQNTVIAPVQTGFYYAVQIGVYKQQRPSGQMFNISPIEYEGLPNGFQRHLTGRFNNRQAADNLKNEIVKKGIGDAFVVAYLNGKRITLAEARDYEGGKIAPNTQATNQNNAAQGVVANNAVVNNQNNQNNQNNKVETQQAPEISNYKAENIFYKVQIGAFRQSVAPLVLNQYKAIVSENIEEVKTDAGLIIYLVGNFKDYLQASSLRNKIINSGIEDAFVVAYHKNKRIPLNIARDILK